jgi:hypothetical protein
VRAHFTAGQAFPFGITPWFPTCSCPLIGALGGAPDFSAIKLGPIALGKFINAVVNFLVVAAAIYFLVVTPMNELAKRRKKEEAPGGSPRAPRGGQAPSGDSGGTPEEGLRRFQKKSARNPRPSSGLGSSVTERAKA